MAGKGWFLLDLEEGSSHGSLGISLGHSDDQGHLGKLLCNDGDNDEGVLGPG